MQPNHRHDSEWLTFLRAPRASGLGPLASPEAVPVDAVATRTASPGGVPIAAVAVERPHLGAIVRHLSLSLLMATVIPSLLFYACLVAGDIWAALIAALTWCYGAMAWRIRTKRPRSALLWIT